MMNQFRISSAMIRRMEDVGLSPLVLLRQAGLPIGLFYQEKVLLTTDEFFASHYHSQQNRGEYYMTIAGYGGLILMDEARKTVFQPMRPGSVHYVPAHTAHRVANTGGLVLTFLACWPSDAGYDYERIAAEGFSARLRKVSGVPTLVEDS